MLVVVFCLIMALFRREMNSYCDQSISDDVSYTSIAGLRCEFGGHLPISSKKCPRPIQVVLGGSYAF